MNRRDLRAGNIVSVNISGKNEVLIVNGVDEDGLVTFEDRCTYARAEKCRPIRISATSLRLIGFHEKRYKPNVFSRELTNKVFTVRLNHWANEVRLQNETSDIQLIGDVKYIHQLQNVYKPIAGIELNVFNLLCVSYETLGTVQ